MKQTGKRVLSMLCTLTMLLSLAAMIVPGAFAESTTTNEIDAIPSGHLAAVRYYSDFATEAGKTAYVDDAEAYGGKAVCYSLANFDGGDFLAIKRYDGGKEVSIKQMFKDDLYINEGYHTYKITYDVPADATEGAVFFLMPNWQLNSSAFCKDFAPYAGQTVEVYLSIKVTGPAANGLYSVSVDRVALATICDDYMSEDGSTCTACGKQDALLAGIPSEHLAAVRYYSDFATEAGKTAYVDDAEAYGGKAVCYSLANFDGGDFLAIKRYDGGKEVSIKQMFKDDLYINEGYHTYKITYDVPADATEGAVFFLMPNWQLNSSAFCKDFAPYAGQTVEVYLSIKVTGPAANGLYSVSVDRVALATICDDYMSEDGSTCTACGKVDALLKMIPSEHRASIRDYSTFAMDAGNNTVYVDDAEAYGGKAVCHTTGNPTMSINRYDVASGLGDGHPSLRIGTLTVDNLKINAGYQLYKFTYNVPVETTTGNTFYIMPNWQLNNSTFCADFAAYAGQTVDVYLSIKVTKNGDLYSIYVDRVALATICDEHLGEDGVTCTLCGKTDEMLKAIPSEHREAVRDYSIFSESAELSTGYVNDTEAFNGKAVCYTKAKLTDNAEFISIGRYDPDGGFELDDPRLKIGSLMFDDLKINQGYQIYKFTYDVPAQTTAGKYLYIMSNWFVQSSAFGAEFAAFAGQTVDVYLSLKVTGPAEDGNYSVYVDRIALATACQWGEGVVTTAPTYETEGVMTYTCSVCGATKTETIDKLVEPTPVENWGLILDGDIGMKFVLNLTAEQIPNAAVEVAIDDDVAAYSAAELVDESGKAVLLIDVAAAQMTEEVLVTLFVDDQEISKVYTVRQYADVILNPENGFTAKEQKLVTEMLNYGAASQAYFAVNTGAYANAGLEITPAQVPNQGGAVATDGSLEGVSLYGASLVHESKIAVRFYFNATSVQGLTSKINDGEPCDIQYKNGKYYVELADICPQNLDEDIVVTVSDGTDTLTVTYAPMDYIIRMYNKSSSSQSTKALVQALYGYYLAAEAYIAQ